MLHTTMVFVEILCDLADGDFLLPEKILEVVMPNYL